MKQPICVCFFASCITEANSPVPRASHLAPRQVGPPCFSHRHTQRILTGTACCSQGYDDTQELKAIPMEGLGKQNLTGCENWEEGVTDTGHLPRYTKGLKMC